MQHKGPVFPQPYVNLPSNISFYYEGKIVQLNEKAEEAATFYAIISDSECAKCDVFNRNFLKDWKEVRIYLNMCHPTFPLSEG